MARPREFDTDKALAGAMDVFWEHGYAGAALPDLLDGMGITRGSLYKAFGDKKTLFLAILDRYDREAVTAAVNILSDPSRPGPARVAALFEVVLGMADDGDRRGCLLCAAASGPAASDRQIGVVVQAMLARMRDGFEQATGDRDTAEMLLIHYVGLRSLVRGGADIAALRRGCAAVVAALPSAVSGA
ncbi:TetR/AcrR family transcriptional regulator [Jannaschia pohangensis]|uniref:Transcriptional regulator, TetR family n=1 Tax=Jannaschia pohangensis TaxID=390807 RepID=A0A1I3Q1A2_9RHOB|nr:TetR/AcrR family transcriptional regulator [Jannaschia pohangensis]SFJ27237.1 transcriptional regulator, TetR family [Jannaschia pohangensis]